MIDNGANAACAGRLSHKLSSSINNILLLSCRFKGKISKMTDKKRIVIVGGGVGGSALSKTFDEEADVTLIDPYVLHSRSPRWVSLQNILSH